VGLSASALWRRRALIAALPMAGCAKQPLPDGLVAPAGTDWSRAASLDVLLDDYAFTPELLELRRDRPYRLVLTNRGGKPHDFTAPDFFRAAATRDGDPVAAAMRAAGGRVEIPAGQVRELAVLPRAAGRFELECVKPLHAMFGMTGMIVVTEDGA